MEKDSFYKGTLRVNVTDQFWIHCRDFKPKPYLKGLEVATFVFVLRPIFFSKK